MKRTVPLSDLEREAFTVRDRILVWWKGATYWMDRDLNLFPNTRQADHPPPATLNPNDFSLEDPNQRGWVILPPYAFGPDGAVHVIAESGGLRKATKEEDKEGRRVLEHFVAVLGGDPEA